MKDFCNWTDANHFMMTCDAEAGGLVGMIETAQRLESPLEVVMLGALKLAERHLRVNSVEQSLAVGTLLHTTGGKLSLRAAVPVGTYRADMVAQLQFHGDMPPAAPVVIECDGFTYHDANRDQAIRDRARDRYMQRMQYVVARFSGDEIVEQPFACAFEVFDLVLRDVAVVNRLHHPADGWPIFTRGHDGNDSGPLSIQRYYYLHDELERLAAGGQ